MTKGGDTPTTRVGDLRYEPVEMEAGQKPADLGALALPLGAERNGGGEQLVAQVTIRKAMHGKVPRGTGYFFIARSFPNIHGEIEKKLPVPFPPLIHVSDRAQLRQRDAAQS